MTQPPPLPSDTPMTYRLPALAVACPTCNSPIGSLCTSHSGAQTRFHNVHQARTAAHREQTR